MHFKDERMEKVPQVQKFHEPIKTNKLKTFSDLNQKKQLTSGNRTVALKADRSLFGRIIVMAQGRDIQMEDILSHPLGPLPWALSTPDGFLRQTNKAALATLIQKNVQPAERIPDNCAAVIDGMSLVQKVNADNLSFGDVADTVFNMALREGEQCKRIDVVFDTYQEISIKNSERSKPGEETGHQLRSIPSSQIVRQWRTFLTKVNNKTSLISFIVDKWRTERFRQKLGNKELFATTKALCFRICPKLVQRYLTYNANKKRQMVVCFSMHLTPEDEGYGSVMICSEDTDVFIMSVLFAHEIFASLFIKCGARNRTRLVDIN